MEFLTKNQKRLMMTRVCVRMCVCASLTSERPTEGRRGSCVRPAITIDRLHLTAGREAGERVGPELHHRGGQGRDRGGRRGHGHGALWLGG